MSLTIALGATVSTTGGTSKVYTPDGMEVKNGIHLIDASVADFRIRPSITARYTAPKLLSDGSYTKGKLSLAESVPMLLESGKTVFNVVRSEIEIHPEATATVLAEMRKKGAQLFTVVSTDSYWQAGSLSF